MKAIKLVSQDRSGLFPEHPGIKPPSYQARATIPAVDALLESGATVTPLVGGGYQITMGDAMPAGLVAVHLNESPSLGLRLASEPPYPVEYPDYWRQVNFTPCPVCNAPVVWYEAGYVPGYRVCAKSPHHHSLAC